MSPKGVLEGRDDLSKRDLEVSRSMYWTPELARKYLYPETENEKNETLTETRELARSMYQIPGYR